MRKLFIASWDYDNQVESKNKQRTEQKSWNHLQSFAARLGKPNEEEEDQSVLREIESNVQNENDSNFSSSMSCRLKFAPDIECSESNQTPTSKKRDKSPQLDLNYKQFDHDKINEED